MQQEGRHRRGKHRATGQRFPQRVHFLVPMAVGGLLAAMATPHQTTAQNTTTEFQVVALPAEPQRWKAATPTKKVQSVRRVQRKLTVVGRQGLTPAAQRGLAFIDANFPQVKLVGGVRPDRLHWHPSGRALDVMVPNLAVGDEVFRVLSEHRKELGITYMLWRRADHFDHVHVNF